MKRLKYWIAITLAFLSATVPPDCAAQQKPFSKTIVLSYRELGPQVLAYKLIGYEWYQWNSHGSSDSNKIDDVKVVVYRNISLEKVKKLYPVIKEKQDYRYLDYAAAIAYIKKNENEQYTEHLRRSREKIVEQLGR